MGIFTSLSKWGKGPLDSFSINTNKILYDCLFICIRQINSMLLSACSVIDHRRRQNVVRTSLTHSTIAMCATFLFLPHFDVFCDLLLNRSKATWNLFVKSLWPELLDAWLALTSVNYHGNILVSILLEPMVNANHALRYRLLSVSPSYGN